MFDRDGHILVFSETIHLPEKSLIPGRLVEISVRDTGIGIPEDQLNKIFICFYRVEDNRFSRQEGTGIGLTIVSEYIKQMGGSIKVSSSPGLGSEFIITIPVTNNAEIEEFVTGHSKGMEKEEGKNPEPETISTVTGRPRLLIIEDNTELGKYLIRLLGNDYQVLTAENGIREKEKAMVHVNAKRVIFMSLPKPEIWKCCHA